MIVLPMGSLAYAVHDLHGERLDAALDRAIERAAKRSAPTGDISVLSAVGRLYDDREAARQPIRAGNWVTLGEVRGAGATTFIDINVGTGETREVTDTHV